MEPGDISSPERYVRGTTSRPLRTACVIQLLALLAAWLPAVAQAQFLHTTNNGTITITGYTGPGGDVSIPDTINGLPVVKIGDGAFWYCTNLASITIPSGVTSIGFAAFSGCAGLTSIMIPSSVSSIGEWAFSSCRMLTSISIPTNVTNIGHSAFARCASLKSVVIPGSVARIGEETFSSCRGLTNVTISRGVTNIAFEAFIDCCRLARITFPSSVTSIANAAFSGCTNVQACYFEGNAPRVSSHVFEGNKVVTHFFLPGTTGWGPTFDFRPTALWLPQVSTGDASFGVRTNQFGFNINWASGRTVVVEACEDLANPVWTPAGTNALIEDSSYFSDPQWASSPGRFYRLRDQ